MQLLRGASIAGLWTAFWVSQGSLSTNSRHSLGGLSTAFWKQQVAGAWTEEITLINVTLKHPQYANNKGFHAVSFLELSSINALNNAWDPVLTSFHSILKLPWFMQIAYGSPPPSPAPKRMH